MRDPHQHGARSGFGRDVSGGCGQGATHPVATLGLEHGKRLDVGRPFADGPRRRAFPERYDRVSDQLTAALGEEERVAILAQPIEVLALAVLPRVLKRAHGRHRRQRDVMVSQRPPQ